MTDQKNDNGWPSGQQKPAEGEGPWERRTLERLAFAALEEQRAARRWKIFFRFLFAFLVLAFLLIAHNGNQTFTGRHTALVEIDGVIEAEGGVSADDVIAGLQHAFESKSTAGVVIRANSPGGSPVQSAYIYEEIARLRELHPDVPVYAVIGDVCASGCYYAVAGTTRIYANPSSVVGSIGVLMDGFGFVDTLKKLGIERRLLTAGEHKGMLDPFQPLDAASRRHAQQMLNEIHAQFIDAVKTGRGKVLKPNREMFSGMFWTGARAKELGLVDDFGSIDYVAREVIKAEHIVDYTVREDVFHRLAGRFGAAMGRGAVTEMRGRIR
jgi:protease-4